MITIKKITELVGHKDGIYAICPEEDGFIISGGIDKHVIRWDINHIENSKILVKLTETIYCLHYNKDRKLIFVGTTTGKIHIIDLVQKKEIKLLKSHNDKIFDFKQVGSSLISVSADGNIAFTDLEIAAFKS